MRIAVALLFAVMLRGGEMPPRLLAFTLNETPAQLTRMLGGAPNVVRSPAFRILQFHGGGKAHASHSCDGQFEFEVFIDNTGTVQSIVWNMDGTIAVDRLFPEKSRTILTNTADGATANLVVRRVAKDRLLIAPLPAKAQARIQQVTLLRSSSVARFLPWVEEQLRVRTSP